ncbi:hypothetical protein QE444_002077 [Pseudomonas sp. SORGH_AS199]|nr:hypothetical protein [Pseudomonas sp. SORGH_AS_0199]
MLGKTTRAVADRVDADAVLDGFERERAGQLGQCAP